MRRRWYNGAVIRWLRVAIVAAVMLAPGPRPAAAQDPPPKIGPFAFDVHGYWARFPTNDKQLSDSRGLDLRELPGHGIGIHAAATFYVYSWRAVTFGLGGDFTAARSHTDGKRLGVNVVGRPITETFTHVAPELSFNFGNGNGWSYVSGGIGPGVWSVLPDGQTASGPDVERLQTINYGGGARWFVNRHIAFTVDVRFYAINPSTPVFNRPGGPRKTLRFMGAGISIK